MSTIEYILFQSPWIPYNNQFIRSRITLTYPENVIFTAQLLKYVMNSDIYKKFPYAEKINPSVFETVNWTKAIIVFDSDLQLKVAPDPVFQLVQLDRRLKYKDAAATIFGPFRFFPYFELFQLQWLGILLILIFFSLIWLIARRYKVQSLALSSKALADSKEVHQ